MYAKNIFLQKIWLKFGKIMLLKINNQMKNRNFLRDNVKILSIYNKRNRYLNFEKSTKIL